MNNKTIIITSLLIASAAVGCAHVPPQALVDARVAYAQAATGPAQELEVAALNQATVAMNQAERSFKRQPTEQKTLDLAYVAERKSQIAETLAKRTQYNRDTVAADKAYTEALAQIHRDTKSQLASANKDLAQSNRQHDLDASKLSTEQRARLEAERKGSAAEARNKAANIQHGKDKSELNTERLARLGAEQKVFDAKAKNRDLEERLLELADFKEEARGLVLTLSGSVLFLSDQSTLLPSAKTRLDQISAALLASGNKSLQVEGYTDSVGKPEYNVSLSQKRADAVRSHLVDRGYPADLIHASGEGETRPVGDNTSAEGRANNRRVEIVVLAQ